MDSQASVNESASKEARAVDGDEDGGAGADADGDRSTAPSKPKERPREALKLALDASAHGFASQAISFLPYCLPNVFIIILLMLFISLISFTTCRFHTQPTNVDLQTKR